MVLWVKFCFLFIIGSVVAYRSINLENQFSARSAQVQGEVWSNITDIVVEARVHDFDASPLGMKPNFWVKSDQILKPKFVLIICFFVEYKDIISIFGFTLRTYGNQFLLQDDWDIIPSGLGTGVFLDVSNRPKDVLIRLGRTGYTFFGEIWNTETAGDYATKTLPVQLPRTNFTGAGAYIGFVNISVKIAWIRVYAASIRGGSQPPSPLRSAGLLAGWNFEDNILDSSPQHIDFDATGNTQVYSDTPSYNPLAKIVREGSPYWAEVSVRVGSTVKLDGSFSYPLGNDKPLSYSWSLAKGPSTVTFSSQSDVLTTFVPAAFGTYIIKLTITETDTSASSSVELSIGAVKTDDHGVVIPEDPKTSLLFGPLIIWGESPWPWLDERNYATVEQFLWHLENNPNFNGEDFMTSLPGTISVTKGSKIITGVGTDFQNTFCGGSTTPVHSWIIVWYKYNGITGRRRQYIQSCDSATQLTLTEDYVASESQSDIQYSYWLCDGCWLGGSTNINYYDNVITLYSFYYRSGQDKYLQKARDLAYKWAKSPVIDGGNLWAAVGGEGVKTCNPRVAAMLGVTWSAYEQNDEFLWSTVKNYNSAFGNYFVLFDLRENAYELGYLAISALLSPDQAYASECLSKVNASIYNRWLPPRNSEGVWELLTYGYCTWNGYSGTVSVTKGSTQVIGTGTTWQQSWTTGAMMWIADVSSANGDPVAYPSPVYVSPTEITLSRPYEGETASGRGWQISNIVGTAVFPYQIGLAGQMFYLAYEATQDEVVRDLVLTSADWVVKKGIQQSTRALYYARGGPGCEPISDSNPFCAFGNDTYSIWAARFLNGEVFGLFSRTMVLDPNNEAVRLAGDFLMAAALGKMGGPGTDDFWAEELTEFTTTNSTKFKNVGFFFGTGFSPSWPAARLAPAGPAPGIGNTPGTNKTPSTTVSAGDRNRALSIVMVAIIMNFIL